MDEHVYGSGNFSRRNLVDATSDMSYSVKSSAVRGGDLTFNGTSGFESLEGPVTVNYALHSYITKDNNLSLIRDESASASIDEYWPYVFNNYKYINFLGNEMRTTDKYDNNGDIITTSTDGWRLIKQSQYSSYNNRTLILTKVYPTYVFEDRASNKSSMYELHLKSMGVSSIDMIRGKPSDERVHHVSGLESRISEEYKGEAEITLKILTRSTIRGVLNNTTQGDGSEWLPCLMNECQGIPEIYNRDIDTDHIFY
jgi:hypothetical protein